MRKILPFIIGAVLITFGYFLIPQKEVPILSGTCVKIDLKDKTPKEKKDAKADGIINCSTTGEYIKDGIRVEIQSISKIEDGIEIVARAWDGEQLGFGDGTVEWERFKIYNPPILAPDGTKKAITIKGVEGEVDNFKEDPFDALQSTLAHIVKLVGKKGTNIEFGKVGNTTSTFFPEPTVTVDGRVCDNSTNRTWATMHDAAGSIAFPDETDAEMWSIESGTTDWTNLCRSFYLFDTSAIPDTDTISAATFSFFGFLKNDGLAITSATNIYTSAPAADTTLAAGDFDSLGTVDQAADITYASFSTTAYNDFAFNATGIGNISKTGNSKFGARSSDFDAPNVEPTYSASQISYVYGYMSNQAGTTNDPTLVVVHAGVAEIVGGTVIQGDTIIQGDVIIK